MSTGLFLGWAGAAEGSKEQLSQGGRGERTVVEGEALVEKLLLWCRLCGVSAPKMSDLLELHDGMLPGWPTEEENQGIDHC